MKRMSRSCGMGVLAAALIAGGAASASAQQTLVGNWGPIMHEDQPERGGGPPMADWAGLPLSEEGKLRAQSWNSAILTVPEHQCKPHPSTYGYRGIGGPRIDRITDPVTFQVTGLSMHIPWMEQRRTVWLDGRPHPPEFAAHTWQGFSTGRWEGNTLVVDTTHLKIGWARRNGVALSDDTTMREYFIRHGDILTHIYVIMDPHYFAEPMIKTSGFRLLPNDNLNPYPCQSVEEVDRPRDAVPHYLPGQNPYVREHAARYHLPLEATLGGPETALPEFIKRFDTSETMRPPR
ncbi:MAG: hypothetical protein HY657_02935, partial [Acidobacteria bacterium]|nr:hypothetical protein [Acidobacteriota bacterium]